LSIVKVTVVGSAGTESEQGVRQLGPDEVRASAPDGIDSSWIVTGDGVELKMPEPGIEKDAHPDKAMPASETTMTRRITHPFLDCCGVPPHPSPVGP
jgi:hypothetical protein